MLFTKNGGRGQEFPKVMLSSLVYMKTTWNSKRKIKDNDVDNWVQAIRNKDSLIKGKINSSAISSMNNWKWTISDRKKSLFLESFWGIFEQHFKR